jgi:hypothetical protein
MMTEPFTTVGGTVGAARERLDARRVTAPSRLGLYAASVGVVAGHGSARMADTRNAGRTVLSLV